MCITNNTIEHGPNLDEDKRTRAVVMYGQKNSLSIFDAIQGFEGMIASQRIGLIEEYGAIYLNRVGGHTFMHHTDIEYAVIRRKKLTWPDFKRSEIRVKSFEGGEHFYAYIDDVQVKQGRGNDTIMKWDTYDEAYRAALSYIDPEE